MNQTEWYGAKTVYRHVPENEVLESFLYEERVIIVKANSFDDAIIEAEKEANEYANEGSDVKYLGYVNVFKLFDEKIKNKTEIYSLMRESILQEDDYIDNFFDTGSEKTKEL